MTLQTVSARLAASVALVVVAALAGCAAPEGEDAAASADAVQADDSLDQVDAMAPRLEGAVLSVKYGIYYRPRQVEVMVASTKTTVCYISRVTGQAHDRHLEGGSQFILGTLRHGHGAPGAEQNVGIRAYLYERERDGAKGSLTNLEFGCIGLAAGYMPTVEEIAAGFATHDRATFVLPESAPAPSR